MNNLLAAKRLALMRTMYSLLELVICAKMLKISYGKNKQHSNVGREMHMPLKKCLFLFSESSIIQKEDFYQVSEGILHIRIFIMILYSIVFIYVRVCVYVGVCVCM